MNVLDFVIVGAIGIMVAVGFFLGIARVVCGVVAIYFAAIFSATFYAQISDALRGVVTEMSAGTAELLAFVFLFFGVTALAWALLTRSIRNTDMTSRFAILDNVGGATLGVVVAGVTIALAVTVMTLLLQVLTQTTSDSGTGMLGTLRGQVRGSALVPTFLRLLPILTSTIRPWFPGGTPSILSAQPEL